MFVKSSARINTEGNEVLLTQDTEYPWKGSVTMTLEPAKAAEFALRIRIPGWATDKPVPTDLYSFTREASSPVTFKVNGSKVSPVISDGYATIVRTWNPQDKVEMEIPMEIRQIKANDNVADDRGKLALQRGPVMFCLEGQDQADSTVFDKFIPEGTEMTAEYEEGLLNGVMTLRGTARQILPDGKIADVPFKAIPYSTWNNRGADQMAVWIPQSQEFARATPAPSIASTALMYSEPTDITSDAPAATSNLQYAWGYNDQWEPESSSDTSKPYHYWWLRQGTEENLCYKFNEPKTVSSVDVYWLDFDHYDGNYRTPESWKLFYRDENNKWKEVAATTPYTTAKDCYNHLQFEPVTTTDLKLAAKLRKGESGGVIEWKVNN